MNARTCWCLGLALLIAGFASAQPLDRLTPTPDDLERLRVSVDPGPVVLVNLLKFKEDGGREAYQRYGAIAGALFQRAGGEIVYAGSAGPLVAEGQDWDEVILARFDDTKLDRAQGATGGVHVGSRSIDRTHQPRRKATHDASTP